LEDCNTSGDFDRLSRLNGGWCRSKKWTVITAEMRI
jgi:hypothetical protein